MKHSVSITDPDHTPDLDALGLAASQLGPHILQTPVWAWPERSAATHFGSASRVLLKLELLQTTGSFKPRGALLNIQAMTAAQRKRGVTAVSAGNHAAAVAWAAGVMGTDALVVMPRSANPMRVALCKSLGAEVELVADVHRAFERVRQIESEQGRTFIHPFEGRNVALGTGTLGLEFAQQAKALAQPIDVLVVPIGGGGLCAGMATAFKQYNPQGLVIGVEPTGANSMQVSRAAGSPQSIEQVNTIADSLGAPHAAPYSFDLIERFVDELVTVDDDAICAAMLWMFEDLKLAVEPAAAATTAALSGPLYGRFNDRQIGTIICGANIDSESFCNYLQRGRAALSDG